LAFGYKQIVRFGVLISLYLLVWVTEFTEAQHAARLIMFFSILLLLFGGGFVPAYTGLLAGFSLAKSNLRGGASAPSHSQFSVLLSRLCMPALALYLAWFPISWVFGHYFGEFMLANAPLFFLLFVLILPARIVFAAQKCGQLEPVHAFDS